MESVVKKLKFNIPPSLTCAIETAALTALYCAILIVGARFILAMV